VLWLVLTGGDTDAWYIGALAVVVGTLMSLALLPAYSWRWTVGGFVHFVPFFLWKSLSGGTDVALRALRPSMPLNPEILDYETRLPENPARIFLANTTSLLPGTLSAELEGRRLRLHTLAHGPEVLEDLQKEEILIARLFGLELLPNEITEKEGSEAKGG
jgi:multicomponent Na+:H+ antiporter subunit E